MTVPNDVTVAVENFRVCGSFGAVPLPGRVQVMPPGVTVAIEKCPRKVSKKRVFLTFVGSGGYPHTKNAVLQKRPVATRAKSHDFETILGPPGGALGARFRHLGALGRDFARPSARKRVSGRGSGRHIRKRTRKCHKREAVGTLKTWFWYGRAGKTSMSPCCAKARF